jgi:cystine transport system permease protein
MELFNPEVAVESLGPLLAGLLITVELTVIVICLSLVLGLLVALARMYGPKPLA